MPMAFDKMEILNLKQNQYAIFTRNKKMISWFNEQTQNLYHEMILNQVRNEPLQLPLDHEPPKIYNKYGNIWAKITNEGTVITNGKNMYGSYSHYVLGIVHKLRSRWGETPPPRSRLR